MQSLTYAYSHTYRNPHQCLDALSIRRVVLEVVPSDQIEFSRPDNIVAKVLPALQWGESKEPAKPEISISEYPQTVVVSPDFEEDSDQICASSCIKVQRCCHIERGR